LAYIIHTGKALPPLCHQLGSGDGNKTQGAGRARMLYHDTFFPPFSLQFFLSQIQQKRKQKIITT